MYTYLQTAILRLGLHYGVSISSKYQIFHLKTSYQEHFENILFTAVKNEVICFRKLFTSLITNDSHISHAYVDVGKHNMLRQIIWELVHTRTPANQRLRMKNDGFLLKPRRSQLTLLYSKIRILLKIKLQRFVRAIGLDRMFLINIFVEMYDVITNFVLFSFVFKWL